MRMRTSRGPRLRGRLISRIERRGFRSEHEGADAAVLEVVHVATADSHAANADADIARAEVEGEIDFADREAEFLFKNKGFHNTPIINAGADLWSERPGGKMRAGTPARQPAWRPAGRDR